jgi:two-component sensor histidine kinase
MKRSYKILAHVLLWLLLFIPVSALPIFIFIQKRAEIEQRLPDLPLDIHSMSFGMGINLIRFFIVFYVYYFFIHPYLFQRSFRWKNLLIGIAIFILLVVQKWFWDFLPVLNREGLSFSQRLAKIKFSYSLLSIALTFIQCFFAWGMKTILSYFDERKKRRELETSNLKSEINMLRSQVNPHFIFNTLNNIDTLIHKDPGKASDLLIKLSDDIRYMLYDANIERVDIASEIKFLKNYISLQEIRINLPNPITSTIEIDNENERIPPMLFIPLVENAFKHGVFNHEGDTIRLKIEMKEKQLDFSLSNRYDPDSVQKQTSGGLGLQLVRRRFELIFPNKHTFDIEKSTDQFIVKFSIDLNED